MRSTPFSPFSRRSFLHIFIALAGAAFWNALAPSAGGAEPAAAYTADGSHPVRAVPAVAGRVTWIDPGAPEGSAIEILSQPEHGGFVSVNPDNTLALVLSQANVRGKLSFDIRITHDDGSTIDRRIRLMVTPGPQAAGWGSGDFYMLETDTDGHVIVEPGEIHRKVYISKRPDALSLEDIAALEGVRFTDEGQWWSLLKTKPIYGSSPEMALAEIPGNMLWKALTYPTQGAHSHWLLMERGYSYDQIQLVSGAGGISPLHPMYISAYGTGARPEVRARVQVISPSANIVLQGIELAGGGRIFNGTNYIFDDVAITTKEFDAGNSEGFTLRNSDIQDVIRPRPVDGGPIWPPHSNRISGFYISNARGVLFENNLFDHNGWAADYREDLSAEGGQPPSMFSHNLYLPTSLLDVTLRDNIVLRAASSGVQMRPGGMIEDNVFIDNNGAIMSAGGGEEAKGNYTLFLGNLATSAGYKEAADGIGEKSYGISNQAHLTTLTGNIVTHLADPDDPAEIARKAGAQPALRHTVSAPFYDDTIVYNWKGSVAQAKDGQSEDRNTGGRDTARMDKTTIQNFTAQALSKPGATIPHLARHLRAQPNVTDPDVIDADAILSYFRAGFGAGTPVRTTPATLRFVPNVLADGVRWDNRLNWDSGDLPGTVDGDRVALAGNWVSYGGTTRLAGLDFGDGGRLRVTHGMLEIDGDITAGPHGGQLTVARAGQVIMHSYVDPDPLRIDASGGRFINSGRIAGGAEMSVSGQAEVILATDGAGFSFGDGGTLHITGNTARVGFAGNQDAPATLMLAQGATLAFSPGDGGLGSITEFSSHRFKDTGWGVKSGINLGGARLKIDVNGLDGQRPSAFELLRADMLIGEFGAIEIEGLGNRRDAGLTIDYRANRVLLQLSPDGPGSGQLHIKTVGDPADTRNDSSLYQALTGSPEQ